MYTATANVVLPTTIIGSLPRPAWYTAVLGSKSFLEAMDDDFNSAGAVGYLFDLIKTYNVLLDEDEASVARSREGLEAVWSTLSEFDRILGLFKNGLPKSGEEVPAEIEVLRVERDKAKKEKNFQRADEIRKQIGDLGYTILDTHSGSTLRKL